MNPSRIEVPLTLPEPHFEDESTIVSARRVVPLDRARADDRRRKLLAIVPILLAATLCGALGAIAVNHFERQAIVSPIVSQPATISAPGQQTSVPAPAADAETPASAPSKSPDSNGVESLDRRVAKSDESIASIKKTSSQTDPKQIVRPRRVHDDRRPASQTEEPKSRGAAKIQDIFSGPNP